MCVNILNGKLMSENFWVRYRPAWSIVSKLIFQNPFPQMKPCLASMKTKKKNYTYQKIVCCPAGSGDLIEEDVDVEIPRRETKVDKHAHTANITKESDIVLSKGSIQKAAVTHTTDDEDLFVKKSKPESTTISPTTAVENKTDDVLGEGASDDDDFAFTDWFGFLGDDPDIELGHSNVITKVLSLSTYLYKQSFLLSSVLLILFRNASTLAQLVNIYWMIMRKCHNLDIYIHQNVVFFFLCFTGAFYWWGRWLPRPDTLQFRAASK